jgi:hypothetical protein
MPTTILTRPATVNFTDNASYYFIASTFTTADQKLQVRVFVDDPYTPKTILLYPPYQGGFVRFSLSDLVKAYTKLIRPKITSPEYNSIQVAGTHKAMAWIEYRIFDPASDSNPAFETDIANFKRYINGGYGFWANQPNFNFEHRRKWFFTWQPTGKLVGEAEPHWLLYCHPFGQIADVEYAMVYTDGSEDKITKPFVETEYIPAERQYDLWYVPTGVEQCDLKALQPSKTIHKYSVRVRNRADNTIYAEFSYRVDYRPNYDAFVVYYRNSLGGWDSLRVLGEWEENNGYSRKEYRNEVNPDLGLFSTDAIGAAPVFDATERRKWKVNTGHLAKSDIDSLRDLMLSKEMAMIKNKVWIPLVMTSESLAGLNTKDALQNVAIEFQSAFENKNYTPDILPWQL